MENKTNSPLIVFGCFIFFFFTFIKYYFKSVWPGVQQRGGLEGRAIAVYLWARKGRSAFAKGLLPSPLHITHFFSELDLPSCWQRRLKTAVPEHCYFSPLCPLPPRRFWFFLPPSSPVNPSLCQSSPNRWLRFTPILGLKTGLLFRKSLITSPPPERDGGETCEVQFLAPSPLQKCCETLDLRTFWGILRWYRVSGALFIWMRN